MLQRLCTKALSRLCSSKSEETVTFASPILAQVKGFCDVLHSVYWDGVVHSSGLDAAQIPLLFEKYKQLGACRSGGSGLGLVLAQQIAEAFATSIIVKSPWQENGHTGTSMEICLHGAVPIEQTEIAVCVEGSVCVERAVDDFGSVRDLKEILIVEDESMNRMVAWHCTLVLPACLGDTHFPTIH
jgi:hypothetical protein